MKTEDLTFFGDDPGAVKFGNFINYYSFHSAKQRVENLHPHMFSKPINERSVLCLDIGCNSGELSKELYAYLKNTIYPDSNIHMLAIDIDPTLIERANESNCRPEVTFIAANVMDKNDSLVIQKYLDSHQQETFDIIFCFSVTMWIHLNNGDERLRDFLQYVKNKSNTIIVEPQPWSCYKKAQGRIKKSGNSFLLYESLKIRNNVENIIESILSDKTHVKVYESPSSLWNRKIQSYQIK